MKRLEPAQQHWTRRPRPAVREHVSRSLRRALALALVDHLEQVAATLRQTPDVDTYMVATAGMARVLMVLSLGAHQLGRPLPPEVIDAISGLHRWAVGVKAQARLPTRAVSGLRSRALIPQTAPKRGSPEAGSEQSSLASGAPAEPQEITACADAGVALTRLVQG
jgi:hypothetical protein